MLKELDLITNLYPLAIIIWSVDSTCTVHVVDWGISA